MVPSLPLLSCESSVSVKKNLDRKKNFFFSFPSYVAFSFLLPSFLHLSCVECEKCVICSQNLEEERKPCISGEKGLKTLTLKAAYCHKIKIPEGNDYYYCTNVWQRLMILEMHLVKYIELVRKYLIFDTRKSKTNMAKKKH